jgi:type II secretory pathway pseudopilin PulG
MLTRVWHMVRAGITLVEVIVAVSVLAIIGIAIFVSATVSQGSTAGGDDNIDKAAHTLTDLSEAIALWTNRISGAPTSFFQVIGAYPGTLSQLTTPITTSDRNSCARGFPLNNATRYKNSQVNEWEGQFFRQELPPTGFLIAPGFFAQDTLLRYSAVMNALGPPWFNEQYFPSGNTTTAGTLAIVMHNVAYANAVGLARRVEGDTTGVFGAVRFLKNATNTPVTVEFHIGIHGC